MVLNIVIPENFERFYNKPIYQHTLKDEKDIFGITHSETGALLLEHWRFPESFCRVIRNHHSDEYVDSTNRYLLNIVKLADILSYIAGKALIDKHPGKHFLKVSQSLGISIENFSSIFLELERQLYETSAFFNIKPPKPVPNVKGDIFNVISIASNNQLNLSWMKTVINYFGYDTEPTFIFPDDNTLNTQNKAVIIDITELPLSQFKDIVDNPENNENYLILFGENNEYSEEKYPRIPLIFSKKELNDLLEGNLELSSSLI